MKSDNPTLEDVAREAKVSTATISRAINDPEKVASETRGRIEKVINRLGYTPNFGGKALASNRSNTVGAIIPTMTNAMFASGLQSFQEELSSAGINLLVASSGYDAEQELRQIRSLVAHGADGLLLIGASRLKACEEFLSLRKIPHVVAWQFKKDSSKLFAGFDNTLAAQQITTHVLDKGHRRVAMIAGLSKWNDRAAARIAGVKRAIKNYDDDVQLLEIIECDYTLGHGGDALEPLMEMAQPPTAIICGNDVLAAGACIRAKKIGIDIPHQLSITGFDDISLATVVSPTLTTVRVPHEAMGQAAARLLIDAINAIEPPASIEFGTEIIERGSLSEPAICRS